MEISLVAHRDKTSPGMFVEDLGQLSLREHGGWVRIKAKEKRISCRVDPIERRPEWPEHVLWLPVSNRKALGLPEAIDNTGGTAPYSGATIEVQKLVFPREAKVYLTIATFVVAVLAAIVTFLGTANPAIPWRNELTLGFAFGTAIIGLLAALTQRQ